MNTKDGQNGSFAFNWVLNQGRQVDTQKQSTGQTSWKITQTFQRGSVCERWGEITCQLWGFSRDYSRKMSSGRGILPAFQVEKTTCTKVQRTGHSEHIWENSMSGL